MEITYIELTNLKTSPLNVRKHGERDGTDLMPSIRRKGVLQPLLVRPNCEGFEIIAGQRRFNACSALEAEGEAIGELPCIIMQADDDAAAIEASLIENIERLPMDEIDQYHAFAALKKQGRSVEDIAAEFGVTERLVQQRLAISNLYEPILNAYRREDIRAGDIRLLTMASKRQQKAWWKLLNSKDDYAPTGQQLKRWLFGGDTILASNALFDLAGYNGAITSDLFGDDRFFGDSEQFWNLQSKAIAERIEAYKSDGWADVTLFETGQHWHSWEYESIAKEQGGKVYITCTADGEVTFHEGRLPEKEAKRKAQAKETGGDSAESKPQRPELTKAMQNYLGLHRHNAVRVALLKRQDIALRLMVAHVIAGSSLWKVEAEPQKAANNEIKTSLAHGTAQADFNKEAAEIHAILGLTDDGEVIKQGWNGGRDIAAIFAELVHLSDDDVMRILTFVMAESLQSATGIVEALGHLLSVNMREYWQPDPCFFDLLRDKQAINEMVGELAGKSVAEANLTGTAKVQKSIVQGCLDGTRKPQVADWTPRYMGFPMQGYTERGGIEAVDQWAEIAGRFSD